MTRRLRFVGVLLCLSMLSASAVATRASSEILGYVDIPSELATVSRSGPQFYVAGWVFNCADASRPPIANVSFFSIEGAGWWLPASFQVISGLHRPDVYAAYEASSCRVNPYEGYHIYPSGLPPPGRWLVWVQWANFDGTTRSEYRDLYIVP